MNRRLLALVPLMALAALAAPANAADPATGVDDHPWIGAPAPAFELAGIDGETLALEDLRGRFVVIHFGTSW